MPSARAVRMGTTLLFLLIALVFVWRTDLKPEKVNLFITAVIGGLTSIYALFTYEILLQNQTMAKAALDSAKFMEQSLRFSHSPNLIYKTINTKDPTFKGNLTPIENDDYSRVLAEFSAGGGQKEFVFAVVSNQGQGAATALNVEAQYRVFDSSNPNRESSVTKRGTVQILEPKRSVALCIFISKLPAPDDRVELVSARLRFGDFYRDAIKEPLQQIDIEHGNHHVDKPVDCVVRLS